MWLRYAYPKKAGSGTNTSNRVKFPEMVKALLSAGTKTVAPEGMVNVSETV